MSITTKLQAVVSKFCLISLSLMLFSGSAAQEFQVHPATQDPSVLVTLDTLKEWEDELSNWGRWARMISGAPSI